MYTPERLAKWKTPDSWFGKPWPDYYVFLGHHRDSDNLDNSNFDTALALLGGESETVVKVCENHWAVGWVEWIAIHESDDTALQLADDIKAKLSDYPVLDEEDYSEREWKDFSWNCEQAVRDYCNDHNRRFMWRIVEELQNTLPDCDADTWPTESQIADCYKTKEPK